MIWPKKGIREFNEHGIREVWKYDDSINPNGPYEVTIFYPQNYRTDLDKLNSKLSEKEKLYFNPANGKYVGYGRAKQLKLLKL
jgi:hypothetical protein